MFQLETVDHVRPTIKVTANLQKMKKIITRYIKPLAFFLINFDHEGKCLDVDEDGHLTLEKIPQW